ncbi:MAG: anti-sigma regulatory factor [Tissierellia bacterium]|jgi:anti-sigma regulatory factor (Ser/Thr protein kinase)|nr:anti-sigma regulatory factor [Tissierellia bacterium]
MTDRLLKRYSYNVTANDFMSAGKGSSAIKSNLKSLGIDSNIIRKIAIISYETEINIVIHSFGGKLHCDIYENKIVIISEDTGPGITDVDMAMKEGFSTATDSVRELGFGAGMGLPNIKKYSDQLEINTSSTGTTIIVTIYL